ncbi:MAG: SPOR domain-containing protein [Gammaproteobacteria bacterium]|nr:SPOR domain-containing protein [Gammaproteobacteria bacterium]
MSEDQTVNIKQRIIGAIVLVSLGIILIPLLLNGGADLNQAISGSNIPELPKKLTRELPVSPQPKVMPAAKTIKVRPVGDFGRVPGTDIEAKSKNLVNTSSENKIAVKNQFIKASKPLSAKVNMAYTLQIASFSKKSNAYALRDKLRKKRFKAYIESVMMSKGKIYRLRVGPYLKFEQISTDQERIEKQFKLSDTVIVQSKT